MMSSTDLLRGHTLKAASGLTKVSSRLRATGNCLFTWFSIGFLDRIYLEFYFDDGY